MKLRGLSGLAGSAALAALSALSLLVCSACGDDAASSSSGVGGSGTGSSSSGGAAGPGSGGAQGAGGGGSGGGGPLCAPPSTPAADWFVAPTGQPGADGTEADPLDLATALSASSPVSPGERVELAAGVYVGRFRSVVAGTANAPIRFAAARGARVTLDGAALGAEPVLRIDGGWVELEGVEVSHGGTDRGQYGNGLEVFGPGVKILNSVVHDTAQGISFWSSAVDAELHGNIVYNNGYEGTDRGHGHAIYTQNATGAKRIGANTIFFGYGYGIHAYTESGSLRGFDIHDNVWFRAGASRPGESVVGTSEGCLVGGLQPVADTRIDGNHCFGASSTARCLQIGWGGAVQNEDITLTNNYLVGHFKAQGQWASAEVSGNAFHGAITGMDPADYPDNEYSPTVPSGTKIVVRRNDYDPGRVDLVVYNWSSAPTVAVDVAAFLPVGAHYEVWSVYDLWGAPVLAGAYQGGTLSVPMGARPPVQPLGDPQGITGADDPGARFGVFVLRSSCALTP